MSYMISISTMNLTFQAAQKRLKKVFDAFYIEVRYFQFFMIIFVDLTAFWLVSLIDEQSTNKKKLAKFELS